MACRSRPIGTPFQRAVWRALREIPCGETRSYGEIARRIGRPKAVRAVGLANGANPIGIVVPCHRVIGSNGTLTGYGGGIERKRWLLAHEGKVRLLPILDRRPYQRRSARHAARASSSVQSSARATANDCAAKRAAAIASNKMAGPGMNTSTTPMPIEAMAATSEIARRRGLLPPWRSRSRRWCISKRCPAGELFSSCHVLFARSSISDRERRK